MAWFGDGLSSLSNLKGQITNFTKEVLSEGIVEEIDERSKELQEANERCVRLEELLNSKDAEISLLRRQNCELQKALVETNSKSKDEKDVDDGGGGFFWDPLSSKHRNSKNRHSAHHLQEQLAQAVRRIRELEAELQHAQQLDNSTTKDDIPDGHRNVEFLRAKQDMVNRIIQLEEKDRNSSHEETALVNEFRTAVGKLESPEKLDLLRSALAALHQENANNAKETELRDEVHELKEENARLLASVEQLDEDHRQAIEEVLQLKDEVEKKHKCLQIAYEKLYVDWNEARGAIAKLEDKTSKNATETAQTQTEEENGETEDVEENDGGAVIEELATKTRDILRNCCPESVPGETIFETVARLYVETKWKKDLLERKVTELTRDLRETSEAKDNLLVECEDVHAQLDSVLLDIQRSKVNLPSIPETELETETESLEEEVTRLQLENQRLNELLALGEKIALESKSELEAADARLRSVDEEIAKLTAEKQKLLRENVSLAEQLTATEDESSDKLELLVTEKALLEQENAELSCKYQRLLDEASQKANQAGELEKELERLRADRENESKELQTVREMCRKLVRTNELLAADKEELAKAREKEEESTCEKIKCALLEAESHREKAVAERDELLILVRTKHEESVQYHAEVQRLSGLMKELEARFAEEQTNNRQLRQRLAEAETKESNARKEVDRLRAHLLEIESSYTEEALISERTRKELEAKLLQAEERATNNSSVYTSASIRANQQVETLQQQLSHVLQQRDDIQNKLSLAEDQMLSQTASLTNLQIVLEQFQRDKERDIGIATERIRHQLKESEETRKELTNELSNLKEQLAEAKECLQAASRLGEELDRKADRIEQLNQEVKRLTELVNTADQRMDEVRQSCQGKVDRNLMKNLLLGYLASSANDKSSVLRVFATVLEFNESERDKAGLNGANAQNSWFSRSSGATSHPTKDQETSLSAAFVKFLENESKPKAQLPALPISSSGLPKSNHSRQSSMSSSQSTLLLSNVTLPTFPDFVPARNSGSILKEVLKDS